MSGFGAYHTDSATTPHRKTHVRFDVDEKVALEPVFWYERDGEQIRPVYDASGQATQGVFFKQAIGWQLAAFQSHPANQHENNTATNALTVPSGWVSENTFSPSTDYGGVTYSPSVAPGDPYYQVLLQAGKNRSGAEYAFSSDASAMPSPNVNPNSPIYRVAIGNTVDDPMSGRAFSFFAPPNAANAPDVLCEYYFMGPIGLANQLLGYKAANKYVATGYYCISFDGIGNATFWQYLGTIGSSTKLWVAVGLLGYCDPSQVAGHGHRFEVSTFNNDYVESASGLNVVGSIVFRFSTLDKSGASAPTSPWQTNLKDGGGRGQGTFQQYGSASGAVASTSIGSSGITYKTVIYKAPATSPVSEKVRVGVRGDQDVLFQHAVYQYFASGTLKDRPFIVPFLMNDTSKGFYVDFTDAYIPAGASIAVQLYALDGTALTLLSGGGASGSLFQIIPGVRNYYAVFTLTRAGGAPQTTPVLNSYRVRRDGVSVVVSPGEFEPQLCDETFDHMRLSQAESPMTIRGAEVDPSTQSCEFAVRDLNGDLDRLGKRGEFCVVIETEYDPGDSTKRAILGRFYVEQPEAIIKANLVSGWKGGLLEKGTTQFYPYAYHTLYHCNGVGPWQRLNEKVTDYRLNFAIGPSGGLWKVTDAIRQLFYMGQYSSDQIDVPDYPDLIFPVDDSDGLIVDPQSPLWPLIIRFAYEYLGAYIRREEWRGTYGKWALVRPATPPYTYRCQFVTADVTGGGHVINNINSYPTVTIAGQTMPQAPIFRATWTWNAKRPEGNLVTAYGPYEATGDGAAGIMSQIAFNPKSFPFPGTGVTPDPNSIDYITRIVPIWQYLPIYAISDPSTAYTPLNYVTRRVYDVACRGRYTQTFHAPLILIDDVDPDTGLTIKRPLTFYDLVYINGDPAIVRHVDPQYPKDDHQWAQYTIEKLVDVSKPPVMMQYGQMTSWRKAIADNTLHRTSERDGNKRQFALEKRVPGSISDVDAMPAYCAEPIQDSSGNFLFMLGLDALA